MDQVSRATRSQLRRYWAVSVHSLRTETQPPHCILHKGDLRLDVSDTLQFWVTPHNKRFPKVTISLPQIGAAPDIDLNDTNKVDRDSASHKMTGIGKQWIVVQKPYDAAAAVAAKPIS